MSTLAIMTRLQLVWSAVPGIARAFTFEPTVPIHENDLPAVYPVVLGRMTAPIPSTGAGQYLVSRDYIYRVLLAPAQAAAIDSGDLGASMDEEAVTFLDAPADHFMQHPRLDTAALPSLAGLTQDVRLQDSGPVFRPGPGGAMYSAVDFTLTITERRFANRLS